MAEPRRARARRRSRARRLAALVAAVVAAAFTAAGCGGGAPAAAPADAGTSGASAQPTPVAGPAGEPYRWLVPTAGPQPSVAAENAHAGTSAWRLRGPAELIGGHGHGDVAGYVAQQAILPGKVETVYVQAPGASSAVLRVYRIGWYGGRGGRLVLESAALALVRQPPCYHSTRTGVTECDWTPTLRFRIPAGLASGVYIVRISASDGAERDCMFVVRPSSAPPLLVQIPTATYEAYNAWGGDSLYPGGAPVSATRSTRGVEVSFDRPYDSETGAGQFFIREVALVRFLERYGYDAGYTTDASIDVEPGQLEGARAVIDAGHSEYWSGAQRRAFASALASGTNLLFMSSDTMAWRVRYRDAGPASSVRGSPGHRLVAYKQSSAAAPEAYAATGLSPDGGARLTGSAYDGCITPRLAVPGPPRYRFYGWRATPTLSPAWLFAGTGVTAATVIPGISGYELDERTAAAPPGTQVVGESVGVSCMSESEPSPVHGALAQSTLYRAPSGAFVFASGTLGWLYGLSPVPEASPDAPLAPDARVVAMTRNLLARALG